MAFWKFCYDFVKNEVIGFFTEFYELGTFKRSLNATFIVLRGCIENLKDFTQIGLVG